MRSIGPIPRRLWHGLSVFVPCAMVCAGLLANSLPARGQDVAEAARQAKERKSKEQKAAPHVYTNDDLKRAEILTPGDQARAEATKKKSPAIPDNQQQQANNTEKKTEQESLGEIAQQYRREKAEREAQEALKKQPSHFQLNLPVEQLASPAAPIRSSGREIRPPVFRGSTNNAAPSFSRAPQPAAPVIVPLPSRNEPAPNRSTPIRKVSPFEPRPLLAPKSPLRTFAVPPEPTISKSAPAAPGTSAAPSAAGVMSPSSVSPKAPAATSSSVAIVPTGKLTRVLVKRGDSWWKLSREYLGRGARWQELAALNSERAKPDFLLAGSEVVVPGNGATPRATPTTVVSVQEGDTLWSIAKAHLGSGTAWTCLAQANSSIANPDRIFPGERVLLPAGCNAQAIP
jgi:nucleoid-associated protein YgaU